MRDIRTSGMHTVVSVCGGFFFLWWCCWLMFIKSFIVVIILSIVGFFVSEIERGFIYSFSMLSKQVFFKGSLWILNVVVLGIFIGGVCCIIDQWSIDSNIVCIRVRIMSIVCGYIIFIVVSDYLLRIKRFRTWDERLLAQYGESLYRKHLDYAHMSWILLTWAVFVSSSQESASKYVCILVIFASTIGLTDRMCEAYEKDSHAMWCLIVTIIMNLVYFFILCDVFGVVNTLFFTALFIWPSFYIRNTDSK